MAERLADFLDSMSSAVAAYNGLTEARPLVIESLGWASGQSRLKNWVVFEDFQDHR